MGALTRIKVPRKDVYLPHINYTVRFRPFKKPPASIEHAKAWAKRDDKNGCTVYFAAKETPCGIAHELVHVLRHICIDRHMLFDDEAEHMAYIMQYLMGQALGLVWA